jgi:predicted RNase H-like nuclease
MSITIIGIDCAVDEKNIGVAVGEFSGECCTVLELLGRGRTQTIPQLASDFIQKSEKTLLALDAPLGWPNSLGQALFSHSAGDAIDVVSNSMFRRGTDKFVKSEFGKQPLDVGADRIARTALAALELLGSIRKLTGLEIALAWKPEYPENAAAIEVYPAGSLVSYGLTSKGYKKKEQKEVRQDILKGLREHARLPFDLTLAEEDANVLDAIMCVLAGSDFLAGNALTPSDASPPVLVDQAKKEGWIWIKRKI